MNNIKTTRDVSRPTGFAEKNDCTVRALSNALEIPYISAYGLMIGLGRSRNKGGNIFPALKQYQHFDRPGMTVENYVKLMAHSGNWIIHVREHVFAVVAGAIIDQYPQSVIGMHVIQAWKVK